MNINKWRVVKHDFDGEGLPFPWHVYPPGAPIATSPLQVSFTYLANIRIVATRTYTEAIARAQCNARTTPTF